MKKALFATALLASLALALTSCGRAAATSEGPVKGTQGPIVDRMLLDAKTQQDIALKDVAEGRSDLFNFTTDGAAFKALPDGVKAKLDPYAITGSSYIDLFVNPYPNAAPYTAKLQGGTVFNPFAIREVRFALNFLINRKQIIDEILVGSGVPMYTPVIPGQPNSSRFGLIASKLGFTATGDEKRALADIDKALSAAADLRDNKGRLVKKDGFWNFDGKRVAAKFLIRVDDPTLRLPEGRYLADQIEKAGIKVERLEYDRTKCRAIWNNSDPAAMGWSLYTDAWVGGQTYAFWESSIAQMYAPYGSFMPGYGNASWWNYKNPEIDKLTQDCNNGRVKDVAEYYDKLLRANELGIRDSIRVWIAAQTVYTCSNKAAFNGRMAYGLGDGINNLSFYTADVKPDRQDAKVLKVSEFSAKGDLFMSAWDPIGPNGFSDTYSSGIIKEVSDAETLANPVTGLIMPMRASWSGVKTDIDIAADGKITGKIAVPSEAVLWNAKNSRWESGVNYVDVKGDGTVYDYARPAENLAWSTATFAFKLGTWHDGRMMDLNDYRYAIARPYELCVKRGEDDKVFEKSYAGSVNPGLPRAKGFLFNKDGTITVYGDANYPADQSQLAGLLCPSLMIEASNYGDIVPWPIHEALKGIVSEGSASKTVYSFNTDEKLTEVDLLGEKCVADIKAKLVQYAAAKAVPACLVGFVSPDQAAEAYKSAIAFIEKHGHAVISQGGFIFDKYDAANKTAVLVANRDPSYPFEKGYFAKLLATDFLRINKVSLATYQRGSALKVTASIADVAFPSGAAKPAAAANVSVTLVGDKETRVEGRIAKPGMAEALIPAAALDSLKPGSYTVIVEAAKGSEAGAVETANLVLF